MNRTQKYIMGGTIILVLLLLVFRKRTVTVERGGLKVDPISVGGINDEGMIFEPIVFDWIGGDCSCEMIDLDEPDIFLPPVYFGQVAAFAAPKPSYSATPNIVPFQAPQLPPAPSYPATVTPAQSFTYRAVTLRPGDSWITNKGAGKVPGKSTGGTTSPGALAFRLSDGTNLAIGLSNRPYVQENVFSANSAILYGGRRWLRSDPV